MKRAPARSLFYLVGYYIGCPVCGLTQCFPSGDVKFVEEGMDVGEVPVLSMTSGTCGRCHSVFRIDRDEIVIEKERP